MYRKLQKIAIPFLIMALCLISIVRPASAAISAYEYLYNSSVIATVNYNPRSDVSIYEESDRFGSNNPTGVFNNTFTFLFSVNRSNLTSAYLNGMVRLEVDIPVSFTGVPNGQTSHDFTVDINSSEGVFPFITRVAYFNSSSPYLRFIAYCYFDNAYLRNNVVNVLAEVTVNVSIKANLGNDPIQSTLTQFLGEANFTGATDKASYSTSGPDTNNGLARLFRDTFINALNDSEINDMLLVANTHLNTVNGWLGQIQSLLLSIRSQDMTIYNGIITQLSNMVANDNRLYSLLNDYLSSALYGSTSYHSPAGVIAISGDVGDLLAQIMRGVYYFTDSFESYVNANQSAAAAVNSEAASQEAALNDLEASLAIPSANVDGQLGQLNQYAAEYTGDARNIFYYLNNNFFIQILVIVVTLGLVGFILYGRS